MCRGPTDWALSSCFKGISLYLLFFFKIGEIDLDTTPLDYLEFCDLDELDILVGLDTTTSEDLRV